MTEAGAPARFYVHDGPASGADSIVKAFLWLKRRIEEGGESGFLAIPGEDFLDGSLKEALGWRLTDVIKEEGALPLGGGLAMEWTTLDAIATPSARPLAAIFPDPRHIDLLRYWPGLVLLVTRSRKTLDLWVNLTMASEPGPENYWPPDVSRPDGRGA